MRKIKKNFIYYNSKIENEYNSVLNQYHITRNACKRMQHDAKYKYFSNEVNKNKDQKLLWKALRKFGAVDQHKGDDCLLFPDILNETFLLNNNRVVNDVLHYA